ncbi:hypothetical protein P3X46_029488 [Hevea brasiliensis]|uniref:C3H1-type domain-containing protein n=1 Tax=Hevea brasiliensis TaxID=3981 RepID=A0ABQ9KTS2_HEVBR|nr:zinc finger CCCH domain-containing protein 14 [Hevea brasiliensis]KAJ9147314.1 hypothetical protein P3X46_029488 [Hevea brasiliensis]
MEKSVSPPSDLKTVSPPSKSPPLASPRTSDHLHTQQFASNFTTLYHSIFPPKPSPLPSSISFSLTPSTSSPSSTATTNDFNTEHRLHQARLILEYEELCDHYELAVARLQVLTNEIDSLRQENADLRFTNNELVKILSLSSQAAIQSRFTSREMVEPNRFERNTERVSLPKSISVRSSGYLKTNRASASNGGGQSSTSNRPRVPSHLDQFVPGSAQHRVCVPGRGKKEDAAVELDVYNQGMWKTELCNKWQETSTCPYGDHCQFAHGITELRPVIRHPRYKTQLCRMVLAGEVCPYDHRCHFRHSLTEQERLMGPR